MDDGSRPKNTKVEPMSQYHRDITFLGLYGPIMAVACMQVSKGQPKHNEIVSAIVELVRSGSDIRPAEDEDFVIVDGQTMCWNSLRRRYRRKG